MEKIENCINMVNTWVALTSRSEGVDMLLSMYDKMDQILPNMKEEVEETVVANVNADIVELVDGVTDQLFVLLQQVEALQSVGVDVWGALQAVCDNNALKFYSTYEEALEAMPAIEKKYGEATVFEKELDNGQVWYGIRRLSDGKILKSPTHPKVSLARFIPEHLL